MSRLFQPLKWALRTPRSLASRLRRAAPPHTAARMDIKYTVSRGKAGARRVEKLVIGGVAAYCFVVFVDAMSEIQGLEGDILVPLPFTRTTFPHGPYKNSDPEWIQFFHISNDPALQEKIKWDLAEYAIESIQRRARLDPALRRKLGGGDIKSRTWFLNLDYPSHPPTEVATHAIHVTDESIALVLRRVEPETQAFVDQIWWPSAMATAVWKVGTHLVQEAAAQVNQSLGPQQGQSDGTAATGSLGTVHHGGIQKSQGETGEQATKQPKEAGNPGWEPSPVRVKDALDRRPTDDTISREGTKLSEIFWKAYVQARKRTVLPPPRGCVFVNGLVELETATLLLTVDVKAWYNPKTRMYDGPSTVMVLRRISQKRQRPLG